MRIQQLVVVVASVFLALQAVGQNTDPAKAEIVTSDIHNFWKAFDAAAPGFAPEPFQQEYLDKRSKGIDGFLKGRIQSAAHLARVVGSHATYYGSIRESTMRIDGMKEEIRQSLLKFKTMYPDAVFPPVYFVVGALNSGGTASDDALIIGADMYGRTPTTPTEELNDWLKSVIKPVEEVPHIVAHELVHFQQKYDGGNLLAASIKEGSADFLAELISGQHMNKHVHDFADPREQELWTEFKARMNKRDYTGWLYSNTPGRPNDLGYWMGYKITKSYYDNAADKKQAIADILTIKNFKKFLEESRYEDKFR